MDIYPHAVTYLLLKIVRKINFVLHVYRIRASNHYCREMFNDLCSVVFHFYFRQIRVNPDKSHARDIGAHTLTRAITVNVQLQ